MRGLVKVVRKLLQVKRALKVKTAMLHVATLLARFLWIASRDLGIA